MMPTVHNRLFTAVLLVLSLITVLLASRLGSVNLGWASWLDALLHPNSSDNAVLAQLIWELRIPRAITAWVVGALLALAGCLMQVLLRNPLADPYVLGVSGGAAFAALMGISLGLAISWIPLLALAGALISVLIVFSLARGSGPWSGTRLLLTGVVTAAGWSALITLLLALSPDNGLRSMLFWLIGDLSNAHTPVWVMILLPLILVVTLAMARSLNVLAMGETTARLLGEPTRQLLWVIYFLASLLTAIAVSVAGSIGFVGLIVPHLTRFLVGSDHRRLLPAATIAGGLFLLLADTLARTLLAPQQLPVGVVTALLGVPLFLLLLNKARLNP